jgi:hypothetical protein
LEPPEVLAADRPYSLAISIRLRQQRVLAGNFAVPVKAPGHFFLVCQALLDGLGDLTFATSPASEGYDEKSAPRERGDAETASPRRPPSEIGVAI